MTVEANNPISRNPSRNLYLGLIASLAVNLLFVGVFTAAAWHVHQEAEIDKPKGAGLLGFVADLPADRQEPLRKEITAAHEALDGLRSTMRQSWLDANAMLTTEPFDKAKFSAALMQLKDVQTQYRAGIYNMVADTASMLTPDERKAMQKWRAERRSKFLKSHPEKDEPAPKDSDKPLTD